MAFTGEHPELLQIGNDYLRGFASDNGIKGLWIDQLNGADPDEPDYRMHVHTTLDFPNEERLFDSLVELNQKYSPRVIELRVVNPRNYREFNIRRIVPKTATPIPLDKEPRKK